MYYKYRLTYYSEYDHDEFPDGGIVYGNSYSEAMENIVKDYGEENISEVFIDSLCLDGEHTLSFEDIKSTFNIL
jgi:hypothetical protein